MLKKFHSLFKKTCFIYLCFYGLFCNVVSTADNVARMIVIFLNNKLQIYKDGSWPNLIYSTKYAWKKRG